MAGRRGSHPRRARRRAGVCRPGGSGRAVVAAEAGDGVDAVACRRAHRALGLRDDGHPEGGSGRDCGRCADGGRCADDGGAREWGKPGSYGWGRQGWERPGGWRHGRGRFPGRDDHGSRRGAGGSARRRHAHPGRPGRRCHLAGRWGITRRGPAARQPRAGSSGRRAGLRAQAGRSGPRRAGAGRSGSHRRRRRVGGWAGERLGHLNTAEISALDGLPGVGPVLAQRIVDWRTEHGRFTTVDELGEVSGIGEKLLSQIRAKVTV